MKIAMISNYINHHQIPFSNAMCNRIGSEYHFIQTEEMEQKRIEMGWGADPGDYSYVIQSYKDELLAKRIIDESDLLIVGWLEDESIIADRLRNGKPVLRVSERLYREGQWKFLSPKGLVKKYKDHTSLNRYPVYLLCCGAYVASDYNLIHAYPGKKYKFGYFPATRKYDSWMDLSEKKSHLNRVEVEASEELPELPPVLTDNEIQIVWAGRLISLKHPEYMVRLASDLVKKGYRFHIHMIGSGTMEDELIDYAKAEMIDDYITFYGALAPEEVRDIMEKCHIHIFTSNFLEGWGAVVNEGMNAGCAEIVNAETGVGHILIKDGINGLLYADGIYENMLLKLESVLSNPELIERYGKAAYDTIINEWNAENAADRVIDFYNAWNENRDCSYSSGPLSVADNIRPRFFANGKLVD